MPAQKKAQYEYVRPLATHPTAPSQILLHRSWAPAKKSDTSRQTGRGQTKQEREPNETEFSLGDWNAGKEDDSLPGPNFDVPTDLFRGTTSEKTRLVVHWLCNSISRHGPRRRQRVYGSDHDDHSVT
jgi:hypothetical protein